MRSLWTIAVTLAGIAGIAAPAAAQAPVAVVEDVKGDVPGIEFMDYVAHGRAIELGPKGSIILGYMKSCWQETIVGGRVIVGFEQSTVYSGNVERTKVACDAGRIQLTDKEATQSAATSFRSVEVTHRSASVEPPITIYGLSPVIETKGIGKLVIRRLDRNGESREVAVRANSLVQGKFYDLAKTDTFLAPGGSYLASLGQSKAFFKIDSRAKPGSTPIIGRLVRLE
ncbi:MAG: hypothetical protein QOD89_1490 [Bradyrhizobium sp.]|jgi:hypothetical protein|nr:hypothetical protein [Bradyrhizobium sp.]